MSSRKSLKRPFNPFVLQLPEPKGPLKVDLYIESLGYVASRLLQEPLLGRELSKDELYKHFQDYLLQKNVRIRTQDLKPRSTNDLRRLDLVRVKVGLNDVDYLGDWYSNRRAAPGRSLLALRSIENSLSPLLQEQDYFRLGALMLVTSILAGETPCITVTKLVLLGMYDKAHEYVEKLVLENNLVSIDIRDVMNNIETTNKQIFIKALGIVREANLTKLLFKVYGADLRLLSLLLSHY